MLRLGSPKTILIIILLLSISLLISGCWGRRETQQMNISTALGFDRIMVNGKPQYHSTVLSSKPPQGGGAATGSSGGINEPRKNSSGQVISINGNSLWDTGRNWNLRSSRRLFIGQVLVVVIGEDTARQGITQILDFLNRHQDMRERVWVIVCQGSAGDFLNAQPEYEPLASIEIKGIIEDAWHRAGKAKGTNLFQLSYDLLTPGKEAAIPYLKLLLPPEPSSPIRQNQVLQEQTASAQTKRQDEQNNIQPQNKSFDLAGTALFKGDKMVGLLNDEETQGLLFLTNQIKAAAVAIAIGGTEQKNATILLKGSKTRLKPVFTENGLAMDVSIKAEGDLMEEANHVFRISKADYKKVEQATSSEIERRCRQALAKSQELNSDIFGFGDKIHRSHPKEWKEIKEQWQDIFPMLQVNLKVEFKLKQTGVLNDPLVVQ